MIHWPTGSKAHRVWRCPPSAVLPHDVDDEREARTEPARGRGKEVHRFLELVGKVGVDAALLQVSDEVKVLCRALNIADMPTHCSTEVAYAYNWRTGEARELGRNLGHRNYHLLENPPTVDELPTTLDVVGAAHIVVAGSPVFRGYCSDYKSGHTKYPRPGEFAQTLIGGLCLKSTLNVDDCILELIYIDPDDGQHYPVRDTVDAWTLSLFEEELRTALESLAPLEADYQAGRGLAFHTGRHCDYCSAFKHCDAQVQLIRAIPGELLKIGVSPGFSGELEIEAGAITVATAARAYEVAEAVIAIAKRVKDEVCGLAWHEPIQLSDGRIIERYVYKRREVDGAVAAQVLEQKYGREEALKAIDMKVSIDAIRQRVVANIDMTAKPRQYIERKDGSGELDKLLAEIERRGGLATNSGEKCEPHQPKKKKLGPGSG